jgi:hypothetical protein
VGAAISLGGTAVFTESTSSYDVALCKTEKMCLKSLANCTTNSDCSSGDTCVTCDPYSLDGDSYVTGAGIGGIVGVEGTQSWNSDAETAITSTAINYFLGLQVSFGPSVAQCTSKQLIAGCQREQ